MKNMGISASTIYVAVNSACNLFGRCNSSYGITAVG